MPLQNQTNETRVSKICETLKLVQKSAASNDASSEEIWALLDPAISLMGEILGQEPESPSQEPVPATREPAYISIRKAAQEASLKDLTMAMAVYLNRIDEELQPNDT